MSRPRLRLLAPGAWAAFQLLSLPLHAQAPGAMPAAPMPSPSPASVPAEGQSQTGLLGQNVPFFDGGTDVMSWDGKHWNVNNQRLFRARFEKFLNAPEQTDADAKAYQAAIDQIMELLSPQNYDSAQLDKAWGLLHKASNYPLDAHLCDALANAIYSTWLANNEEDRLSRAATSLEQQRADLEWDAQRTAEDSNPNSIGKPADKNAAQAWLADQKSIRDLKMQPYVQRLTEVNAMIAANKVKREASQLQAKIEFQSLLVQLFMQRRFQHVLMGTGFYRHLFGDGDTALHMKKETQDLFTKTSGMPPTLGVLDSLSQEAIRDVKEGVDAYLFLLSKKELASATERLAETCVLGEYVPEVRNLSRDKKRQALLFLQKENQLLSAIDVKDYALAEKLVGELQDMATDFDASKPLAAIQTAKTVSAMHLAKAKTAAASGDRPTLESELKAAMEVWPRNPDLAQVSATIFHQADVQQQALSDLERLTAQHNYRQIFDDRVRFIAATALYPDRQESLRKVLDQMQQVEEAIIRSTELAQHGNYAGAWEGVEKATRIYPDDSKLNQLRAQYTTQAADFVRDVRTAQDQEKKGQTGSSLAWYLKAQKLYPESEFAQQGIERLAKAILPDAS
ncbi:MAG: hypothetical protein PW734_08085 [Verrucomicrobium sp.]|nr:hypothetical protein [Verrucomicrobium sp.]